MKRNYSQPEVASLLERFFSDYLISQRNVSPATVCAYRDTFRLLLRFAHDQLGKPPAELAFTDIDAPQILGFLNHLENKRRNCVRSRNARLAAIRSFMRYAALQEPTVLPTVKRILAIPVKRFDRPAVDFLSREEVEAVLAAPDTTSWSGHRDLVLLATLYNTGARVSEIIGLNVEDLRLAGTATVRIQGKGRKERVLPLWKTTKRQLDQWLGRINNDPGSPLFPNRQGLRLTRSGVRRRLQAAIVIARSKCPTLCGRRVSPHLFRHTTAMHLLQSGVDMTVIALWLGHESITTTHMYVEADMTMKIRAIGKITKPPRGRFQFQASDPLLAFLDAL